MTWLQKQYALKGWLISSFVVSSELSSMKPATKANTRRRSRDVEEWVPLVNVAASHFHFITAICLPFPRMWGRFTETITFVYLV
jgi:hypothetical protein